MPNTLSAPPRPETQAAVDDYPASTATGGMVAPGQTVTGTIETGGDDDWFALQLDAGQSVRIELTGQTLSDPVLTLRDDSGAQLVRNDDIDYPANPDSALIYTAPAAGTYYIEASGYGRETGSYEVSVEPVAAPTVLDSIQWGTQLPDNNVQVYFAPDGYRADGYDSEGFNAYEIGQFQSVFDSIEAVIDIEFTVVNSAAAADLVLLLDTDESNGDFLGYFNPPGTTNAGVGVFDGTQWDRDPGGDLEQGGYGYVTIMHELLHGLGLAHPHDTGGTSTVMPGVFSAFGDYGVGNLNQGVFTTMTYNSGFSGGGPGRVPTGDVGTNFGFEGTPMALDIAALQDIYGANPTHANGNSVYTLPSGNGRGTYWQSIWDTGGIDEIRHAGNGNATIDLRPATLEAAPGGGGFTSAVNGTAGGYTIAHGAIIENATGGRGSDHLIGNDAHNLLKGGFGNDLMQAGTGNDRLFGGVGFDRLEAGGGNDLLDGGANADNLFGQSGQDTLRGGDGLDRLFGGTGNDFGRGGTGNDGLFGEQGNDTLNGEQGNDRFFGGAGNDDLDGSAGNDTLYGGAGFDTLKGGAGNDLLQGNFNADTFVFENNNGDDIISDFDARNGLEKIDLSDVTDIVNLYDLFANHMDQAGANTVINIGAGNSITLVGVNMNDLDNADFIF